MNAIGSGRYAVETCGKIVGRYWRSPREHAILHRVYRSLEPMVPVDCGAFERCWEDSTDTKQQTVKEATMRKPELAAAIAEKADLTKEQANRVLNALLDEITGALNRKDSVTLVGFGTFLQRHRGARTGKNPQTGQPVKIKASNTVAFKPGKASSDAVN